MQIFYKMNREHKPNHILKFKKIIRFLCNLTVNKGKIPFNQDLQKVLIKVNTIKINYKNNNNNKSKQSKVKLLIKILI
jgi:hypothetical protein